MLKDYYPGSMASLYLGSCFTVSAHPEVRQPVKPQGVFSKQSTRNQVNKELDRNHVR